jgi:uncharacterized protein YtpQ (UPF0354 family)
MNIKPGMLAMQQSRHHLLDRDAFAQCVQPLRTHASISTWQGDDGHRTLHVRGRPIRIKLETIYPHYRQGPVRLDALITTLIRSAQQGQPSRQSTSFNTLRKRIYPMLKPVELLIAVREQNLPMLTYQLFLSDLIITYVIDEQGSVSYINEQHMKNWNIDMTALHTVALDNLRSRTAQTPYTTVGEGVQRLFIYNSQDGYDATRLLLPEVLEPWRVTLPGHMVIGIPNRDFLVAFSDNNQHTLTNLAHQIQLDKEQHAAGLTDQLFILSEGTIQEYTWK